MFRKKLLALGITPNLDGFKFLNEAIQLWDGERYIGEIEQMVAEKFNTTPSKVERCMRHAIEKTGKKETVSAFVSTRAFEWKEKDYFEEDCVSNSEIPFTDKDVLTTKECIDYALDALQNLTADDFDHNYLDVVCSLLESVNKFKFPQ